jgi:hypothetical protein
MSSDERIDPFYGHIFILTNPLLFPIMVICATNGTVGTAAKKLAARLLVAILRRCFRVINCKNLES